MEILILTGMSGSGKSVAVNSLEDIGYFCIDNLPPQLLADIVIKLAAGGDGTGLGLKRLAVVVDSRSAEFFPALYDSLRQLDEAKLAYWILFLDSADDTLIRRYKQSRRNHPMAEGRGIAAGIAKERELLKPLRERADIVFSTDNDTPQNLARRIQNLVQDEEDSAKRLEIIVQSFGFKYGVPADSDLVLDVRFLPNPFYVETLRPLSGLDKPIADYVYSFPETGIFLEKQLELLLFLLPYYVREGKMSLTISVGCTGGRHRSVLLAEAIARRIKQDDYKVTVAHRDIAKDLQK